MAVLAELANFGQEALEPCHCIRIRPRFPKSLQELDPPRDFQEVRPRGQPREPVEAGIFIARQNVVFAGLHHLKPDLV